MPALPKINNEFKKSYHWIKKSQWEFVPKIYIKQDSTWFPLYQYEWKIKPIGDCSHLCGGGTQDITIENCIRNDGINVLKEFWTKIPRISSW